MKAANLWSSKPLCTTVTKSYKLYIFCYQFHWFNAFLCLTKNSKKRNYFSIRPSELASFLMDKGLDRSNHFSHLDNKILKPNTFHFYVKACIFPWNMERSTHSVWTLMLNPLQVIVQGMGYLGIISEKNIPAEFSQIYTIHRIRGCLEVRVATTALFRQSVPPHRLARSTLSKILNEREWQFALDFHRIWCLGTVHLELGHIHN